MSDAIKAQIQNIPEFANVINADILNNIAVEVPKNRQFGDFSTNAAMVLVKVLGKNPREIAGILTPYFEKIEHVESVSVAGPGFINLKLKDSFVVDCVFNESATTNKKSLTIDLDYGGYNIGKSLHIGHLRTSVVGDCFNRVAKHLGHKTKSYNHMGDWGRPMGLIIAWIMEYGMPKSADEINKMYPASSARAKEDEDWLERAKKITTDLQNGNEEYLKVYESFTSISLAQVDELLKRLHLLYFDENKGERLIAQYVPEVEEILKGKNALVLDDGALIIPVKTDADTEPMPPVMWKSTAGSQTYAAADLTAVYYREKTDNPDAIVYFTDNRQNLHFKQIFRAAGIVGFGKNVDLQHIGFGTITGTDGKPFKTRDGNVPSLDDMLNIVADSVRTRVKGAGKELDVDTIEMIALAALKFNDLMHDVKSDYIFDVDSVTSFEGKTGPYILYTAVRLQSILNKIGNVPDVNMNDFEPGEDERNLLMTINDLHRTLDSAFEKRATYLLANYTYDLAQSINTFYHNCPILRDDVDGQTKAFRLQLVKKSLETLAITINLMGLEIPNAM